MISTRRRISILMGLALGCSVMISTPSYAVSIPWADWIATNGTTTVDGTVGGVGVHFVGNLNPGAQVSGGTDFWAINRNTTYASSPTVDFGPPNSDVIRLTGGGIGFQKVTFDGLGVVDPVMAILSLGSKVETVDYLFDAPFVILNQGQGFFGQGFVGSLANTGPNIYGGETLRGIEGHGLIQFNGTFKSISWTIPSGENWHGITLGGNAAVPEPASLMLLGAGLAAIGIWRRKAGKIG